MELLLKIGLTFVLVLSVGTAVAWSQTENVARLVDEYGVTNCDDYRGRIDILLIDLQKNPDSRGAIIVYDGNLELPKYDKQGRQVGLKSIRSEVGLARELLRFYKNHLLFRYFPMDRVDLRYGGFRQNFTTALWSFPKEADSPKPTPTLLTVRQRKKKKGS